MEKNFLIILIRAKLLDLFLKQKLIDKGTPFKLEIQAHSCCLIPIAIFKITVNCVIIFIRCFHSFGVVRSFGVSECELAIGLKLSDDVIFMTPKDGYLR
jgi:hypothetical protein